MVIGNENNNYSITNFNELNNIAAAPSMRRLNESIRRNSNSNSLTSLISLCTNSSCSSISTLTEMDLSDGDKLKFISAVPSEDEDEDWMQFGYLLEENENILPQFENLKHFHHHRHNQVKTGFFGNVDPHQFHRSFSLPSMPESQKSALFDDSTTECSGVSFTSLRVEAPLSPPASPLSLWASSTTIGSQSDSSAHECPKKPFKEDGIEIDAINASKDPTQNQNIQSCSRSNASEKQSSIVKKDDDDNGEKKKTNDDDEPIAKRTRRRDSQKSENESGYGRTMFFSPYCFPARPWWMSKLMSMRRQNAKKYQRNKRKSKKSTTNDNATKRQVLRKDNPDEPYTLCDPRYISLGGNTVPFEEMPMKMELDFSGNAKITTQSDLLNVNQSNKHSKSNVADISMTNVENDESDDYEDENPSASTTLFAKKSKLTALGRTTENDDESEIDSNDSTSGDDTSEDGEVAADVPAKRARSSTTTSKLKNGVEKPTKKRKKNAQAGSTTKTKTANVQRRVLGQQQRRDRERRLHIIQVRKTKNADTPPIKKVPFGVSAAKKSKIAQQRSVTSTEKGAEAKYCSCGVTYDPKKTYISCGTCSRWYHAKCAGLTEKRAQKMAGDGSWTCGDCERSSDDVYCVCRRPYDDTKFYVGCDSCEDWFHPECIGTTQAEVSKQDTFLCPKCRESDI